RCTGHWPIGARGALPRGPRPRASIVSAARLERRQRDFLGEPDERDGAPDPLPVGHRPGNPERMVAIDVLPPPPQLALEQAHQLRLRPPDLAIRPAIVRQPTHPAS